jgi:DUSAM domain-containing protein
LTGEIDWDPIRALAHRVLECGEELDLTEETRTLLRRSAQEVAISLADAEDALRSISNATILLREIRGRIREGSNRLSDALHRAYRLRDAGDIQGARKQLEDVLAVEVVPLYREEAEIVLEKLARLKPQQ